MTSEDRFVSKPRADTRWRRAWSVGGSILGLAALGWVLWRVDTDRLFGAIMAGYLTNLLVPLGISPLVRSRLAARLGAHDRLPRRFRPVAERHDPRQAAPGRGGCPGGNR